MAQHLTYVELGEFLTGPDGIGLHVEGVVGKATS